MKMKPDRFQDGSDNDEPTLTTKAVTSHLHLDDVRYVESTMTDVRKYESTCKSELDYILTSKCIPRNASNGRIDFNKLSKLFRSKNKIKEVFTDDKIPKNNYKRVRYSK